MKFTKMQGIGNDYIYINCFQEKVENPSELSVRLSDRRFGIGSDGIILIKPSSKADCEMDIYNADGSRAMMCGNGIRCVGKYVYDRGICRKNPLRVDMGAPILAPAEIPVTLPGERAVNVPYTVSGREEHITCVSMGNPHCVLFVEDVDALNLEKIGPAFEHAPIFPQRVNTEFIQVLSDREVRMRVWERGSGETWACGTGACAAAVACALNGKTGRKVLLHLRGGDLTVTWEETSGTVFMEGPAAFVFDGTVDV